jgi:hypothetical protein
MTKYFDALNNAAFDEADVIFDEMIDSFPSLDENDSRRECVLLRMMTNCVLVLHHYGWSEKMLIEQVVTFCEKSRDIFDDDDEEDE